MQGDIYIMSIMKTNYTFLHNDNKMFYLTKQYLLRIKMEQTKLGH